jgi:cystathionine gamma-synthase
VDPSTGAVAPPLHLSTTYEHPADAAQGTGYIYGRYQDPTGDRLREALCALEGGAAAQVFATGMAAAAALFGALPAGSHVVLGDDTYFAVRRLALEYFPRWGLTATLVDTTDTEAVRAACTKDTRCIWVETPSNPLLAISDVRAIADIARARSATLCVDSTFAPAVIQQPLALGADVVMHSTTKFLGGHSDVLGGALVFAQDTDLARKVDADRRVTGATAAPFSSYMVLRGIRTLACRMEWHCRSALALATFLEDHKAIERVHYPGLASHPQHAVARAQMRKFGGVVSIEVRGGKAAALRVASALRLFCNATSLGGFESLVEHRKSVEGPNSKTPDNLLRLSVGLEDEEDLREDLAQALCAVEGG